MKMKKMTFVITLVAVVALAGVGTAQAQWTPAEINTDLWLDASDASTIQTSGSSVTNWNDKSGNGNDVSQGTGTAQPTTGSRTQNSLNAIDFDGGDYLDGGDVLDIGANDQAAWAVFKMDTTVNNCIYAKALSGDGNPRYSLLHASSVLYSLLDLGPDYSATASFTSTAATMASIIIDRDVENRLYIDGSSFAVNTALNETTDQNSTFNFLVGAYNGPGFHLDGLICELIIMNSTVSTDDRQKIEGYLAWKWGLEGNLPPGHPYENAAPAGASTPGTLIYGK